MIIQASSCKKCGRTIVPPRETCPYCGKRAGIMESIELDGQGKVVSFTTLQMPPEGFEPPLTLALVELEHGALVLCLAKDEANSKLKIDDRVEISIDSENRFQFLTIP